MSVKTAIIGLGIMGRRMAEHMALHPGYELTALWDPDKAACSAAQDAVQGAPIVSDADAAIAAADLVYLACPPVPRKASTAAWPPLILVLMSRSLSEIPVLANQFLSDYCALTNLLSNGNGPQSYNFFQNAFDPTIEDLLNGNCNN